MHQSTFNTAQDMHMSQIQIVLQTEQNKDGKKVSDFLFTMSIYIFKLSLDGGLKLCFFVGWGGPGGG